MARPEQPLHRDGTPLRELAFWLRDLRTAAGLTYAQLAARSRYSVSTLQDAAAGRRLPTQAVVVAFATGCGADAEQWRQYWVGIRRATAAGEPAAPGRFAPPWAAPPGSATSTTPPVSGPDPAAVTEAPTTPSPAPRPRPYAWAGLRRRPVTVAAASGLLLLAVAVPGGLWLASSDEPEQRDFASVVVQNKVAVGATTLVEDSTPVYLSGRTVSHCAARGCKLTGTDMWSGAKLVVSCWTRGESLTNADVTSPGIGHNEGVASSDLWYRAKWKDGRTGYLPEVYVVAADRGGARLARCDD